MTVGYFCATPLHILHAVTMRLTTDRDATGDIVVYNHFADAPRMVMALEGLGLFRRVTLYDNHTLSLSGKARRLWHSLVPDRVIRPLLTGPFPYDKVVFFALDALTMTQLMQKGRSCAFYYGEDGIGSYINPALYRFSDVSRLLLRLTGRQKYLAAVQGIYLHDPDLRVVNTHLTGVRMERLPFTAPAMVRVLRALWTVEEAALDTTRPVTYFREPLREVFGADAPHVEEMALALAEEAFGPHRLYIKRHPRMAEGAVDHRTLPCNAPYERLMELWDQSATTLVSVISTAALQPLLLCGQQPTMIFLYRLLLAEGQPMRQTWDTFFEKLNARYGLGDRLFIPGSADELKEAMTRAAGAWNERYGNETGNPEK